MPSRWRIYSTTKQHQYCYHQARCNSMLYDGESMPPCTAGEVLWLYSPSSPCPHITLADVAVMALCDYNPRYAIEIPFSVVSLRSSSVRNFESCIVDLNHSLVELVDPLLRNTNEKEHESRPVPTLVEPDYAKLHFKVLMLPFGRQKRSK